MRITVNRNRILRGPGVTETVAAARARPMPHDVFPRRSAALPCALLDGLGDRDLQRWSSLVGLDNQDKPRNTR